MARPKRKQARPAERLPYQQRAGTHLDHRFVRKFWDRGKDAGSLDESQRVYQHGGEFNDFVLWKRHAITIPRLVWDDVKNSSDQLEMVDNVKNEVYIIDTPDAQIYGFCYTDPKIGPRFGVDLWFWLAYDGHDEIVPKSYRHQRPAA